MSSSPRDESSAWTWELVTADPLRAIAPTGWATDATHCGVALGEAMHQALCDALQVHAAAGACLCVGRAPGGALGAATVLLPSAGTWQVALAPSGRPAWVLPALRLVTGAFAALPPEVRCIQVGALSPVEAREAEALTPAAILRWEAQAHPRAAATDAPGSWALSVFRDEAHRLRHLAWAPLVAWWSRRRQEGEAAVSGSRRLRAQSMRVEDAGPSVLALFDAPDRDSMQYGSAWLLNFAATVRVEGAEPWLHVLLDGEVPLAVLPLWHVEGKGSGGPRLEAMANYYTGVWAPPMAAGVGVPELRQLLAHVRRSLPGAHTLTLAPMAAGRDSYSVLLEAMRSQGWFVHEQVCFGNWYLPARGTAWATYLKGRSAGLRSTLKRLGAKFQAEGGRMELITCGDRLEAGIEAYEAVYKRSWKVPEPHVHFVPGLMRACAARGWLRLGVAWMGEQPAAAQFWIVARGRADIFKVGYDESYARFSIGSLLTGFLMQHALDVDRVDEVDYLIGDDTYKKTWMASRRERWGLVGNSPWTARGLYRALRTTAGAVWRAWKLARGTDR